MKRGWIILIIVIGVLITIRLALEPVAKYYINSTIDDMEGYSGGIQDIDISLLKGTTRIEGIALEQTSDSTLSAKVDTVEVSVNWGALWNGEIEGEVLVYRPVINYVAKEVEEEEKIPEVDTTDWVTQFKEMMPITINRFEIVEGNVSFRDPTIDPGLEVPLKALSLVAKNISNVEDTSENLPSSLSVSANSLGGGQLNLDMRMDILNKIPEFDMQLKLMSVNLPQLNEYIMEYGNFDVKKGTFSLITEMRVDEGKISGYIKPFMEDLNIFSLEQENEQDEGFFRKAWEALVGLGSEIFENQPKDRVATEVPIEGNISSPDTDVSSTIYNTFKNAFVDAIEKEFESRMEEPS